MIGRGLIAANQPLFDVVEAVQVSPDVGLDEVKERVSPAVCARRADVGESV